jgi:AraC family transcriptional regulator, regulatory protein of adaptative response / methylated-DNA-[protein]-cysteine methyltransferase
MIDYQRIASAITYIREHSSEQPSLDNIAAHIHLSPFHFQRMFKEWAGVSPKKFLQYISVQHARQLLQQDHTIADVSFETGLSGTSRLHDLFVSIEAMTPGEFKNGGEHLLIDYTFTETVFGKIMIAATPKGVCKIDFIEDHFSAINNLKEIWPNAQLKENTNKHHQSVTHFFKQDWNDLPQIKLHLKGTPFQLKVWEALLKIPSGELSTYSTIAGIIKSPKAFRAVGTAIGDNPIAYLIPCHRIIKSTGIIGEYHWGSTRKTSMIGWEQSRLLGEAV